MSATRSLLPLLVVMSCAHTSAVAAQKPKPKPAPPRVVKPAKPEEPASNPSPEPAKPAPQQWRIEARYLSADQSSSITTYATDQRQRVELAAGSALVTQCDMSRVLQINEKAKAFAVVPLVVANPPSGGTSGATPRLIIRTATTDTGERRTIHGHEARRIRIVTTTEPQGQGCEVKQSRTETDGWYASVPELQVCGLVPARPAQSCIEYHERGESDSTQPGYPLAYTTTIFDTSGKEVSRISGEVTSLLREPRNETLFEAPVAFTQVPHAEALASAARRAELEALGITPKAHGMIRVGVVLPSDSSGRNIDREALGNEVLEAFSESPIEAVPIVAATTAEQSVEAAAKECDFVLRTELAELTTSKPGRVGGLMRRATGGGNPAELHEAKINFALSALSGGAAPTRTHAASARTGAFTWRRAVGVARFAGRLYFGMTAGVMNAMVTAGSGSQNGAVDPTLNALATLLPPEKAGEDQSPEAAIIAAIERGATELKRSLAPSKSGQK